MKNRVMAFTRHSSTPWAARIHESLRFLDRTKNSRLARVEFESCKARLLMLWQEGLIDDSAEMETRQTLLQYAYENAKRRAARYARHD